jgi:hypothetical protein
LVILKHLALVTEAAKARQMVIRLVHLMEGSKARQMVIRLVHLMEIHLVPAMEAAKAWKKVSLKARPKG